MAHVAACRRLFSSYFSLLFKLLNVNLNCWKTEKYSSKNCKIVFFDFSFQFVVEFVFKAFSEFIEILKNIFKFDDDQIILSEHVLYEFLLYFILNISG